MGGEAGGSLARQTLYRGEEGLVTLRTVSCASGM